MTDTNRLAQGLIDPLFGAEALQGIAETRHFPKNETMANAVFQVIHDELFLDGNARQNLATFCQTWDDEYVHKLMDLSINKNWIDKEEYPQSTAIDLRCVSMLADLWNAPKSKTPPPAPTQSARARHACSAAWP